MRTNSDITPDEEVREEMGDPAYDFWSDEGVRRFNEILDEGRAFPSTDVHLSEDFEAFLEDEQCEYLDPEPYDPDEETLPPGEMELIFENSYIMKVRTAILGPDREGMRDISIPPQRRSPLMIRPSQCRYINRTKPPETLHENLYPSHHVHLPDQCRRPHRMQIQGIGISWQLGQREKPRRYFPGHTER